MRQMKRILGPLVMAALLGSTIAIGGCAVRMYDRDHDDYHRWNHHEDGFYIEWEHDTHRDHRDFRDRDDNDKREYWNWRHNHHDHDHDRDHD